MERFRFHLRIFNRFNHRCRNTYSFPESSPSTDHTWIRVSNTSQPLKIEQFPDYDFDPSHEHHAFELIDLLKRQGIDFQKNHDHGIDSVKFSKLMISSGLKAICKEQENLKGDTEGSGTSPKCTEWKRDKSGQL
ncbi:hypothetical protein L6452_02275 [Arctium lappa]|uniref:Uncharacterized protein n=1 Tax=Arctium lappa TaxID=4217 RepID=A0ACB9FIM8_ARCLA|nr:hypothetical protein L6452_02275 [Arctium lappa]